MKLRDNVGSRNIREAIGVYPGIGEILGRHDIGCVQCTVGTCLLQDVVAVHFLGDDAEARIEREINAYLESHEHSGPEI